MTIDNLKCFLLVAENLSFARAAETLYISQPAVTKQINSLEQELGVSLFIRSTRHVELTPAGMSFYKDAKDIVMKSQMAVERLQKQSSISDSIHIGLSNPASLFYLTPILTTFHEKYPDVRPHIETPGHKIVLNLFLENKLDLLFYHKENMPKKSGIHFLALEKDHMACLLPAGHPLAEKQSISLEDISNYSIIVCNPLNAPLSTAAFQQQILEQHPANHILYCDTVETAHCMVAAGMGISILPSIMTLKVPDFAVVPFRTQAPLSFGIFYCTRNSNPALKKFLKLF